METTNHSQQPAKAQVIPDRNIELKARISSDQDFEKRMAIAKELTGNDGEIIQQRDVFFKSQSGRFKLRHLKPPARSQLVYYDRPDISGPKLSKYNKIELDEPEVMEKILTQANGMLGVLEKTRHLFIFGKTRIHIDKVKDLGNFMEFEFCLSPDDSPEDNQANVDKLMQHFGIKEEDLIMGSYFDELQNKEKNLL